jgi:hypothetical protein
MATQERSSDEMLRAARWSMERMADLFAASPAFAALPLSHQTWAREMLCLAAEACSKHAQEQPQGWTVIGLGQFLGQVVPHHLGVPRAFRDGVAPVLTAFVRWGIGAGVFGDRDLTAEVVLLTDAGGTVPRLRSRAEPRTAAAPSAAQAAAQDQAAAAAAATSAAPIAAPAAQVETPLRQTTNRSRIAKASKRVYVLRIELVEITPPIWRRIAVGDITLAKLHGILQTVMGWRSRHLHMWTAGDAQYVDPRFGLKDEGAAFAHVGDQRRVRLPDVLSAPGQELDYEYDYGDSWHHRVICESIEEPAAGETAPSLPRCLEGARACPPEDVGGSSGYAAFLAVLADPAHAEFGHFTQWATGLHGERFDPERFDLNLVNRWLRARL